METNKIKKFTAVSTSAELLHDPSLVEDYNEIIKYKLPDINTDESVSGSVVLTPATDDISPLKQLNDLIITEQQSIENIPDDEHQHIITLVTSSIHADDNNYNNNNGGGGGGNEFDSQESIDLADDYAYSDSDFEDNLEKRLKDLDSEESDKIQDQHIDERIDEDDEDSYYKELAPPKELDPEKLYALYSFDGPDPSHCKLEQDEPCILLNDQDAYWWLVKRCSNSKIGFAPAEILETYPERLARLNCWKNENMSNENVDHIDNEQKRESGTDNIGDDDDIGDKSLKLNDYKSTNKSVSFSDVINYAERYIDSDGDDNERNLHDEFTKVKMEAEDVQDDVSEVSFATGSMIPLNVKKTRTSTHNITTNSIVDDDYDVVDDENNIDLTPVLEPEQEQDENDNLHKIFEAPPILPFNSKNTSKVHDSNSDYSISTIGEYSPSSSEVTNDGNSPQLQQIDEFALPSSRAIQDISKIVDVNIDAKLLENRRLPDSPKFDDNDDGFYMADERIPSSMSISSTHSLTKSTNSNGTHPLIAQLYSPVFDKMDNLLIKIDSIVQS